MNYVDRMFEEFQELDGRCKKLDRFMDSKRFEKLTDKQQEAMNVQMMHMGHYVEALMYRIICECTEDSAKDFSAVIFHGLISTNLSDAERIPIRMAAYDIVTALIDSREKETNHDEERKAHRN